MPIDLFALLYQPRPQISELIPYCLLSGFSRQSLVLSAELKRVITDQNFFMVQFSISADAAVIPPSLLLYAKKMESVLSKSNGDIYQLMPKETLQSLIEAEDRDFARTVVNAINQRV